MPETVAMALREADEAAILRPTQGATAILRAPGIVLRVRRRCRGPLARQQDLTTQISSGPRIVRMPQVLKKHCGRGLEVL